jgi:Protein of unknown function (DUF1353)
MFKSTLEVAHIDGQKWRLTRPLIWEGGWQYVVIRSGFETDFVSIPKPVRWLLDNAGRNSEAAVLHDAVWRESKRPDPRIDPWLADGMFRRALRETGSTALARGLMWFAVRATAMVSGRFGKKGPSVGVKILQLVCVFLLGAVFALAPTLVAGAGLAFYWIGSWVVAIVWFLLYEWRHHAQHNWPWPSHSKRLLTAPPTQEMLLIFAFAKDYTTKDSAEPSSDEVARAQRLRALLDGGAALTEEQIDLLLA